MTTLSAQQEFSTLLPWLSPQATSLLLLEIDWRNKVKAFYEDPRQTASQNSKEEKREVPFLVDTLPENRKIDVYYRQSEPLKIFLPGETFRTFQNKNHYPQKQDGSVELPFNEEVPAQSNFIEVIPDEKNLLSELPWQDSDAVSWLDCSSFHASHALYYAWLSARFPQLTLTPCRQLSEGANEVSEQLLSFIVRRIILSRRPSYALLILNHLGILETILPELTAGQDLEQNRFHKYDIFEHLLESLDSVASADEILRWSALLHDIGKVETRQEIESGEATFYNHEVVSARQVVSIMKRFQVPREQGKKVRFLVRHHMFHYTTEWTDRAIRRFMNKVPREDLEMLIALRLADRRGSGKKTSIPKAIVKLAEHIQRIEEEEKELKVSDLEINGHTLMELGIQAGPHMGKILRDLLEEVKQETLKNEREVLLERVHQWIKANEK